MPIQSVNANPLLRLSIRRIGFDHVAKCNKALGDNQMKVISKGKPATQIKAVRKDSKKSLILAAMLKGTTTEEILKLTGWAKSAASSVSEGCNQGR